MNAVEIQDHARKLYEVHGAKALVEANDKAREYEASGKDDQAKDWRRIAAALQQLRGPRVS